MISGEEPPVADLRGLKCPLPVLKTAKRLAALAAGDRLVVLTTDPMASIDLPHFCAEHGHQLLSKTPEGDALRFEIEKR